MSARRVCPDVSEVEIKRNQPTLFRDARCKRCSGYSAGQTFHLDRLDVVPCGPKCDQGANGNVLVQLETQQRLKSVCRT